MKTINLTDALSGQPLRVEYELGQNNMITKMKINGILVERKTALEQRSDVFIYGPIGNTSSELFHLYKSQLNVMRSL